MISRMLPRKFMRKKLFQHFNQIHAQMSWMILEYNLVYHNSRDGLGHFIHDDWMKLRSISDEEYEKRVLEYCSLSAELNLQPTAISDVSFDVSKGSRKLVAEKLSKAISNQNIHLNWPDGFQQYQKEQKLRAQIRKAEKEVIVKKKRSVKRSS